MKTKALLIVDYQNDFCPGGALAVPQGDTIVRALNKYIDYFCRKRWPIFASRDWHPPETSHFKDYGGVWPAHCVQDTNGARFHPKLRLPKNVHVISKGMSANKDSYSAFQGEDSKGQEFLEVLRKRNVSELFVGGLATDYCVKSTVCDALKFGFKAYLLIDAIKGVNLKLQDSQRAIEEMVQAGAQKMTLLDLSPKRHHT